MCDITLHHKITSYDRASWLNNLILFFPDFIKQADDFQQSIVDITTDIDKAVNKVYIAMYVANQKVIAN